MKLNHDHISAFREHLLREEKSPVTIEKYLRDVRGFLFFAGDREVTKELTMAYKNELVERGYALRSVNSMLASVNSLLSFLGLTSCKVKNIRTQRQTYCAEEKELTKAEYLRLLAAAGVKESKVFPHNLRKLFARTFYSMEKDIAKLADILGHSSINTTRIYIITTGTEHRRMIERLGLVLSP